VKAGSFDLDFTYLNQELEMENQSRRNVLRDVAKAAIVAVGGLMVSRKASAQTPARLEKRNPISKPGASKPTTPPIYTDVVAYGNLLFVAGKSQHLEGTIEEHTKFVLDLMEKNLIAAGSSLRKVLKVNVYLKNIEADIDKMNAVYKQRDWGDLPPARTTTSTAGGLPSQNALVMIDCIAYI
jgi:2-iminobutanoate/2-iminopropanoate deaminase